MIQSFAARGPARRASASWALLLALAWLRPRRRRHPRAGWPVRRSARPSSLTRHPGPARRGRRQPVRRHGAVRGPERAAVGRPGDLLHDRRRGRAASRTSGSFADRRPRARAPASIVRTDGNGVAQVVYQAPPRTDATANQTMLIAARPVGDRRQRGASTARCASSCGPRSRGCSRRTRTNAGPPAPCDPLRRVEPAPDGFRAERADPVPDARPSTSDGTIVRYEWNFGDGTRGRTRPDSDHVYRLAGHLHGHPRRDGRRRRPERLRRSRHRRP